MKTTTLFKFYILHYIKIIAMFLIFSFIFGIVISLYNLPVEAVSYGALLCFCVGMLFAVPDFYFYCKKHRHLSECINKITFDIEQLPPAQNLTEQDYQELIRTLYRDKAAIVSRMDSENSDMMDYYSMWVHQIKTPIAAMRLLLQNEDTEENNELTLELFKIEQYTEMVLQYLRLESSSTDFILKYYSLDDIVKQAVRKYAKMFVNKKIVLEFDELSVDVLTDEKWLLFAIEQILSNGIKYTAAGKISIYMDKSLSKTLVIEDTGIGIQEEDLPRVFEKGYTGYNGHSDKKSTGIGLYLCRRILTKLSHTLEIQSQVGKGTKVKIGLDTVEKISE